MKRVAEIIYIVDSEREAFLNGALNLTDEEERVLWHCGVRKQQYFALNDLIFMTFEYAGNETDFPKDMEKMASYLDSKGLLVKKRRRDVPIEERTTTNWWAPVKRLGEVLATEPASIDDSSDVECLAVIPNYEADTYSDIAYDEEDWTEGMHF